MATSNQELVDHVFHELHDELYKDSLKGKIYSCKYESALTQEDSEYEFLYDIRAKNGLSIELYYDTSSTIFNCNISKNADRELMKLPGELSSTLEEYLDIKDLYSCYFLYYENDNNNRTVTISSAKEISFKRWTEKKLNTLIEMVTKTYEVMMIYEKELFDSKNQPKRTLPSIIEGYMRQVMEILNSDSNISKILDLDHSENIHFTTNGFSHEIQLKCYGKILYIQWNLDGGWEISILHDRFNLTQKVFKNLIKPLLDEAPDLGLKMEGAKSDGIFLLSYKYIEFDKNDFSIKKPEYLSAIIIRLIVMVIKCEQLVEQYLSGTENTDNILSNLKKLIFRPSESEESIKETCQETQKEIDEDSNNFMQEALSSIYHNVLSTVLSPLDKIKTITDWMPTGSPVSDIVSGEENPKASREQREKSLENISPALAPEFRQLLNSIYKDIITGLSHADIFKNALDMDIKPQIKDDLNEFTYNFGLLGAISQIRMSYHADSGTLKICFIAPFDVEYLDECENCCKRMTDDQTRYEISENDREYSFYYETTMRSEGSATFEIAKTVNELVRIYTQMKEVSDTLKSYY